MGKHKYKGPTASIIPKGEKKPRAQLGPIADRGYPKICFRSFDWNSRWGDGEHCAASFADIVKKLAEYETMTWAEISTKDHSDPLHKLCSKAQKRLGELSIDHDELFRFRFSGTERLWGVRDTDDFFVVLWWDPCHEVREYNLPNT